MKPLQNLKYAVVAMVAAFVVACSENPMDVLAPVEPDVVENPDYKIIRSLGLSTEGIVETKDSYIVEGDIAIYKNSMQDYAGKTRQLYRSLIPSSTARFIIRLLLSHQVPMLSLKEIRMPMSRTGLLMHTIQAAAAAQVLYGTPIWSSSMSGPTVCSFVTPTAYTLSLGTNLMSGAFTVRWYVNNVLAQSGSSFSFTPSLNPGHNVELKASYECGLLSGNAA